MSNKDTFTDKKIEYAPLKEEYEIRSRDKYKSMQRCLMFVLDRINSCLAEK
jgi:hypothetical protein